jgi:hypothetical protein
MVVSGRARMAGPGEHRKRLAITRTVTRWVRNAFYYFKSCASRVRFSQISVSVDAAPSCFLRGSHRQQSKKRDENSRRRSCLLCCQCPLLPQATGGLPRRGVHSVALKYPAPGDPTATHNPQTGRDGTGRAERAGAAQHGPHGARTPHLRHHVSAPLGTQSVHMSPSRATHGTGHS